MDAVDRRYDGRDELRRQRQHQAQAKALVRRRLQQDAVAAGAVLQHRRGRASRLSCLRVREHVLRV